MIQSNYQQMTSESIALKEMKAGILDNLEPSQREKMKIRLKTEIKIMWEHDHDHLVKAVCRPEVSPVAYSFAGRY